MSFPPLEIQRLIKNQLVTELYNPANQRDPARINEIQTRLQQLQKTENAWAIADSLLQSEHSAHHRFMGALTFTVKINVSWYGQSH
jgi:precorrin-3B methylase